MGFDFSKLKPLTPAATPAASAFDFSKLKPITPTEGAPATAAQPMFIAGKKPKGLVAPGNVDLAKRPVVKNADGTVSTVRSMSFEDNGKEVLVPTVSDDGRVLSNDEAVALYRRTGRHLGIFDNPDDATAYAQGLHEQQAKMYPAAPAVAAPAAEPSSGLVYAGKSLARSAIEGAGQLIQGPALGQSAAATRRLTAFDQIDRGEDDAVFSADAANIGYIGDYQKADPATRQRMRAEAEKALDPRNAGLYKAGAAVQEFGEKQFPREEGHGFLTETIPEAIGSTIPFAAAAVIGRRAGAGTTAPAAAASASQAAAAEFQQALEQGASIDTALKSSGYAAALGTSEALPIGHWLDRLDKGTGGSIRKALTEALKQGTEEGLQEVFQQVTQNAVAQKLYDPKREMFAGAGTGGAAGFTVGALMGFLGGLLPGKQRAAVQPGADDAAAGAQPAEAVIGATPLNGTDLHQTTENGSATPGERIGEQALPSPPGGPGAAISPSAPSTAPAPTSQPVTPAQPAAPLPPKKPPSQDSQAASDLQASQQSRDLLASRNADGRYDAQIAALDKSIAASRQALGVAGGDGTKTAPVALETPTDVHVGAAQTNPEPSPAQIEAGNYKKRHLKWRGLELSVETEAGGVRRSKPDAPVQWQTTMAHPYGYFLGTRAADSEPVDIYIGPRPQIPKAFVIDQVDPKTGKYDEAKAVIGVASRAEAADIYDSGFSDGSGPLRRGAVTEMSVKDFKAWLRDPKQTRKPVAYKASQGTQEGRTEAPIATAPTAEKTEVANPAARGASGESISAVPATTSAAPAATQVERAPMAPDETVKPRRKRKATETDIARAYFKPGAVLPAYGGKQRIISFDEKPDGTWTVTAQALDQNGKPDARYPEPLVHHTSPPRQVADRIRRQLEAAPAASPAAVEQPGGAPPVTADTQAGPAAAQPDQAGKARADMPVGRFLRPAQANEERDELRPFKQFAAARGVPIETAARDFVREQGEADGFEHIVIIDTKAKAPLAAATSGKASETSIPANIMAVMRRPRNELALHHNHPYGVSLSAVDISLLGHSGLRSISAYTGDYDFSASLTPALAEIARKNADAPRMVQARILRVMRAATKAVRQVMQPELAAGRIEFEEANFLATHVIATAAARAGLITYDSTVPESVLSQAPYIATALENATEAAKLEMTRRFGGAAGAANGQAVPPDRNPTSVQQRRPLGEASAGPPGRPEGGGPEPGDRDRVGARGDQGPEGGGRSVRESGAGARVRQQRPIDEPISAGGFTISPGSVREALLSSASSRTAAMQSVTVAAMDKARILLQDKMLRLKRVEQAIEKARAAALPTNQGAYLAEELYHGITGERIDRFRVDRVEPLAKAISDAGVTVDQVNDFLYARHAPERNAQIASINESMPDGGSGMTNAEAAEAMEGFRSAGLYDRLNGIAQMVDRINRETVDTLTRGDLIDAETRAQWNSTYRHYVPLRGFEQGGEAAERLGVERARIGKGFDIRGDEAKRAMGRESRAGDILAHVLAQHEEAIVRAEKNKVGKTFLRLVGGNPEPSVWEVDSAPLKRVIDKRTGLVTYEHDNRYQLADDVMAVKVGGEAHYITIKDPALARAMKNLGSESTNGLVRAITSVVRLLAKLLTQWNPAFTIPNLVRDLQTALINIQSMDVPQVAGQIVRDMPAALRGAFGGQRGRDASEWQRWYREFAESGGKISFFGLEDVETRARALRKMVKNLGPGKVAQTKRAMQQTGQFISDLNGAVENATRLSAYANLRRQGVPKEKAASVARNLTVNFNRRGEWSPYLNAAYLFYNASLQGSVTMLRALVRSRKVQAIAVGGVLLGFLEDRLNDALSPDDDDGEKRWDNKIGEWTKDHNIVIMNPWASGDDGMVALKIPLPYGYNIFPMIGRRISESMRGKEGAPPGRTAAQIVAGSVDSFSPVGSGSTLFDGWEGFVRGVSPTLIQPAVEIAVNMDYAGKPIQKPKEQHGKALPEHMRGFSSVGPVATWVTRELAEMTGGSDIRSGAIDVSPAALDHLFEFFTGGVGRTVKQALELPIRGIEGDWEEVSNPRNWPVVNRFIEGKNQWYTNSRFYQLRDAIETTEAELRAAQKTGDTAGNKQIRNDYAAEVRVIGTFNYAQKQLGELYKQRRVIEAAKSLDDNQRKARLDAVDERIAQVQQRAIKAYAEALGKAKAQ